MEKITIELTREEAVVLKGLIGNLVGNMLTEVYTNLGESLSTYENDKANSLGYKYKEKYGFIEEMS